MKVDLGAPVSCSDGPYGELGDVVVDPASRTVTHLVVRPDARSGTAHLIPIALVEAQQGGEATVSLVCSLEEANRLAEVEEFAYLAPGEQPPDDPAWDVGEERMISVPGDVMPLGAYDGISASYGLTYDRVPKGEAELGRASIVAASNGDLAGGITGFVLGDGDGIAEVLIERGALWRRRTVTIPAEAISGIETGTVTLRLSLDEVDALPSTRIHGWF